MLCVRLALREFWALSWNCVCVCVMACCVCGVCLLSMCVMYWVCVAYSGVLCALCVCHVDGGVGSYEHGICGMCIVWCCVGDLGALCTLCVVVGDVWMAQVLCVHCAWMVCVVNVYSRVSSDVLWHPASQVSCIIPADLVHIPCEWLCTALCPFCELRVCSSVLPVGISACSPTLCRLFVCALWVIVDTSRRRWLLSSNREQPLTHSLIRIMLTLLLPTKNICLFNQSLLNALHLFSQWERMGLLSPRVYTGVLRGGGTNSVNIVTGWQLSGRPTASQQTYIPFNGEWVVVHGSICQWPFPVYRHSLNDTL